MKKFFLFVFIAAVATAVMRMVKGRRGGGLDDSEWQELPPPASS
jgi:hypothetical protein